MSPEPNDVLNRLAAGEISADEAASLLTAPPRPATPSGADRWLHVRVTHLDTGKQKVNVNVPLSWVELGMRLGARYSPEIAGVDFGEVVQMLRGVEQGRIVEVEDLDDNQRVEVYVD